MAHDDKQSAAAHAAEVEAMVARLERGREIWRDYIWPGGSLVVRMRVLTTGELQEAEAAAFARMAKLGLEIQGLTLDTLAAEKVTQVLMRACGDPAAPVEGRRGRWHPMFRTADVMRDATTSDERAAMWANYEELRVTVDPSPLTELDEDAVADIDEALKKRSLPLLASIGSWRLASYLLTTVYRPSSSPTHRSSSSSDSESSSSTP